MPTAGSYAAFTRKTLDGARRLIDPAWGGMYQYSDTLDWSSPHYEKLLNIQRDAVRAYVLAYQIDGGAADLAAARDIARWLMERMRSPEGAFFVSQDADLDLAVTGKVFYVLDDAGRRKLGREPTIDRNLYARETGWAAAALATLHDVTGEAAYLDAASRAVDWAVKNRRAPNGAFGHARAADDDTHLGDTLGGRRGGAGAVALDRRAALADPGHRGRARHRHPSSATPTAGFVVRQPDPQAIGVLRKPVKQIDENVAVVRFLNLVRHYSGDKAFDAAARHGMAWLVALAANDIVAPGAALADAELSREPMHVTIMGGKDDPEARALYETARRYPTRYLRIEWIDKREGPMPNPDVEYPDLPQAAAFACANGACSLPVFAPGEIATMVRRIEDL